MRCKITAFLINMQIFWLFILLLNPKKYAVKTTALNKFNNCTKIYSVIKSISLYNPKQILT